MSLENCKVIVNGNDVVELKTSSEDWKQDFITEPSKEEWYGTKFVKGKKSDL